MSVVPGNDDEKDDASTSDAEDAVDEPENNGPPNVCNGHSWKK